MKKLRVDNQICVSVLKCKVGYSFRPIKSFLVDVLSVRKLQIFVRKCAFLHKLYYQSEFELIVIDYHSCTYIDQDCNSL